MGQRLLTTLGTLLVLGGRWCRRSWRAAWWRSSSGPSSGLYALPFAGAATAAVVGVEVFIATLGMGQLYASFEFTE